MHATRTNKVVKGKLKKDIMDTVHQFYKYRFILVKKKYLNIKFWN